MKRRAILAGSAGAVLLLAAGGAAGVWAMRSGVVARVDADAKVAARDIADVPDDVTRQAEPLYYTFDKPFTANMRASAATLQAGVSVSSHYAQTIEDVKNDAPALRAAILMTLSDLPEDVADNESAKEQLATRLAAAINRQLRADDYRPAVDAAYFSDFVVVGNDDAD